MPSPFPGMKPYLEQEDAWHDFHDSFTPRVRDLISVQVDPRYIVKIDEHLPAVDLERLAFLEIRDCRNRQLVTLNDKARYATYVYDGSPEPPLSPEQASWARQFLPERTERDE
jgi:hypothetical protein